MKKLLVLILGTVFVVGFAASAFAIHATIPAETTPVGSIKDVQISLGGEIRFRGWYETNITDSTGAKDVSHVLYPGYPYDGASMSWYDQRYRLGVNVKAGDNVSGRILLESGAVGNGDSTASDKEIMGKYDGSVQGTGGTKNATLDTVLEGWIAYTGSGLLGVPAGLKIGHMPLMVGAGQFFDHRQFGDDALLFTVEPAKGTEINLITVKLFEGGILPTGPGPSDNTDDMDAYVAMITHKLDKDNTVGIDYTYINQSNSATSGYCRTKLQNLGLNANGTMSGVGYRASVDLQFGKAQDSTATPIDTKYKGYAITAGANYKLDPVTLRASFAMGSGDKTDTDDKYEGFVTFVGNLINYTVVYDYRITTAGGGLGMGIANTTSYNVGVDAAPVKDMTVALDYFMLRASKKLSEIADTYGNKKDIGSEVDLKATYKLAKNLTYFINSGILFAGDFYKDGTSGYASDPKDVVVFQHGLTLSF